MKMTNLPLGAIVLVFSVAFGVLTSSGTAHAQPDGWADKAVLAVVLDDGSEYPYPSAFPPPPEVDLGVQYVVSITSEEVNYDEWDTVPNALVAFYADIPPDCWGRWYDPDGHFPGDVYTVGGIPWADPFSTEQLGEEDLAPHIKKTDDAAQPYEIDLHFYTNETEPPQSVLTYTRFFEFHCDTSSWHDFEFCNKVEPLDVQDPNFPWNQGPWPGNNMQCEPYGVAVIADADKYVDDIVFDDALIYPDEGGLLPDHPTKTLPDGVTPLQVLDVPASENRMISVTSIDCNDGPDDVADALVNFYADIPEGCEGRWVIDPAGANAFDTRTVEGDPFAPPFSPEQLGTTVPPDDDKEPGGDPVYEFESDLHFQTADYGMEEPAYTCDRITRFFELHCYEPAQYHFNFCNKIEGYHTNEPLEDPHPNLYCEELVVEASGAPEADKQVLDIEFQDEGGYSLPYHATKIDPIVDDHPQVLHVAVSENVPIQVISWDYNDGPDPVPDALISSYADVPEGCEGRWNPWGVATRTTDGDPWADPFSPEQWGTEVPADDPKEPGDTDGPWPDVTFESDTHWQTSETGVVEEPGETWGYINWFDLHCFEPGQHHFTFCNKIEPKPPVEDPNFPWNLGPWPGNNLRCEELVVEASAPPEPHYECYYAPGFDPPVSVNLETQFPLEENVAVRNASWLCAPAIKNFQGTLETLDIPHLRCFDIDEPAPDPPVVVNLTTTQFGTYEEVEIGPAERLCVPATKAHSPDPAVEPPPQEPHYKCYYINPPWETHAATVQTQFYPEGRQVTLEDPVWLCVPAIKTVLPDGLPEGTLDAPHFLQYYESDAADPPHVVNLLTQFGPEENVEVGDPIHTAQLWVPVEKEVVVEEQDPSLSLHEGSSSFGVITPVWHTPNEADVFDANAPNPPNQTIPCGPAGIGLGLPACPAAETLDELNSLSYGVDFSADPPDGLHWLFFSVAPRSAGVYGSAVAGEFSCLGNAAASNPAPEPEADVFGSKALNDNIQNLDGDGQPCNGNAGPSVGLLEPKGDDLDALDEEGTDFVDPNGDGIPNSPIYFTLDNASPSTWMLNPGPGGGPSGDDVFVCNPAFGCPVMVPPMVYADGVNQLGLQPGDEIDALCLKENGDGEYQPMADDIAFSLTPSSPTVTTSGGAITAADVLRRGPIGLVVYQAAKLGLLPTDDLNALKCFADLVLTDGDVDGMPDQYENQHWCLNPGANDANVDFEPDGLPADPLTNAEEFALGTDPCVVDTDDDGCADGEEVRADGIQTLGGQRDPLNRWDFFDVPLPVGAPGTGARDKQIDGNDALAVLAKFGASPGDPIPTAPKYDPAYDRSAPTPNPWNTQAPEGVSDGNDVIWALAQFGHSCAPAP